MPPAQAQDVSTLYPQVHKRLVDSGEWDKILLILTRKLNEAGWIDDIRHQSKESAKVDPTFEALFAQIRPDAETSVPLTVKKEVEVMIREFLETQLEG